MEQWNGGGERVAPASRSADPLETGPFKEASDADTGPRKRIFDLSPKPIFRIVVVLRPRSRSRLGEGTKNHAKQPLSSLHSRLTPKDTCRPLSPDCSFALSRHGARFARQAEWE